MIAFRIEQTLQTTARSPIANIDITKIHISIAFANLAFTRVRITIIVDVTLTAILVHVSGLALMNKTIYI